MRASGYIVETIDPDGRVRAHARGGDWDSQLVIDTSAERILPRTVSALLGFTVSGLPCRYQRDLAVPPGWVNVVVAPADYAYGSYQARVPVARRYGRRSIATHVGPNIRVTYLDRQRPAFCFYYLNPNADRSRRFRLSVDLFPIVFEAEGARLYELWGEIDPLSRREWSRETFLDEVISQALRDYESPDLSKVRQNVPAPSEIQDVLRFLVVSCRDALKILSDLGMEIEVGKGRHAYKVRNPGTGVAVPVPMHSGDIGVGVLSKIFQELGLKEPYTAWRKSGKWKRKG